MRISKKIVTSVLSLSMLGTPLLAADNRSNDVGRYDRDRVEHRDYDHRDYDRRDDHRDYDRRDHDEWRGRRADWVKLGTVTVGRHEERDLLEVPGRERFTAIMFRVADGDLVLDDLKVTFGDDSSFSPQSNIIIREGQRSGIIDLPGVARDIKRIRFLHRSLNRSGAVVEVYGLR